MEVLTKQTRGEKERRYCHCIVYRPLYTLEKQTKGNSVFSSEFFFIKFVSAGTKEGNMTNE
jgi:hypothetical protein